MKVKICGITTKKDALYAEHVGADAIGFIFVPKSKRYVSQEAAWQASKDLGIFTQKVGVFMDQDFAEVLNIAQDLKLDVVQLHGAESNDYVANMSQYKKVMKVVGIDENTELDSLKDIPAHALMIEGVIPGSGVCFDWSLATRLKGLPNLILAGGLTPDNVAQGIRALLPYGVDVASGVEASYGVKDPLKVLDFVRNAKEVLG